MATGREKTIMKTQRSTQKRFLWLFVVVAAGGLLGIIVALLVHGDRFVGQQYGTLSTPLRQPNIARAPSFALTDRSGKEITLADLRERVWVADFIWTRCPDECPLMSAVMARLQAEFADEPDFRLVSISVDPEYDTPAVLTRYATRYGANPDRWLFLTGDKETIYRLVREGFKLAVQDPDDPHAFRHPTTQPGTPTMWAVRAMFRGVAGPKAAWAHAGDDHREQPVIHSDRFVLVDGAGWIQGYYSGRDPQVLKQLIQDARELLRTNKNG
ncbi:MAG: SCO family protein [Candidatus Methylomirabilales bacterium]